MGMPLNKLTNKGILMTKLELINKLATMIDLLSDPDDCYEVDYIISRYIAPICENN